VEWCWNRLNCALTGTLKHWKKYVELCLNWNKLFMLYSHHLASLEAASQELQAANNQMFKSTQVWMEKQFFHHELNWMQNWMKIEETQMTMNAISEFLLYDLLYGPLWFVKHYNLWWYRVGRCFKFECSSSNRTWPQCHTRDKDLLTAVVWTELWWWPVAMSLFVIWRIFDCEFLSLIRHAEPHSVFRCWFLWWWAKLFEYTVSCLVHPYDEK
jgi:hypothetical protein